MNALIEYLQLGTNALALSVAGWIYLVYIKNIRSTLEIKDEQIKVLERTLSFWKDKAADYERKTPEYMEDVLTKRIKLREDEIKRLNEDHEAHAKTVSMRTREVARLRAELERTVYLGTALTYFDTESEVELPIPEEEITVEELGEIFVDSASILITDPLYVQREWNSDEEYTDSRQYRYVETGKVYTFGEEFVRYDEPLPDLGKTPNELLKSGTLQPVEVTRELTFSLPGAMYATSTSVGYGELQFAAGHTGAGLCVKTVYGDGTFTIYGERFRGDLVRIYIDLR